MYHLYRFNVAVKFDSRCPGQNDSQNHCIHKYCTICKKECRRDIHSGFETHEEGHTKSKTGAISGSTKWTLVQRKQKVLYNLAVQPSTISQASFVFQKQHQVIMSTGFLLAEWLFATSIFHVNSFLLKKLTLRGDTDHGFSSLSYLLTRFSQGVHLGRVPTPSPPYPRPDLARGRGRGGRATWLSTTYSPLLSSPTLPPTSLYPKNGPS